MGLDCQTPRGLTFVAKQDKAARAFAAHFGYEVRQTAGDAPSDIDALFYRDDRLVGIAEIKVRNLTLAQLRGFGTYLITFDKLLRCADLSRRLCVPFILLVWLETDGRMMYWKVTDETGAYVLSEFGVKITTTQATCNGGQIERVNAYLPVALGRLLSASPPPEA